MNWLTGTDIIKRNYMGVGSRRVGYDIYKAQGMSMHHAYSDMDEGFVLFNDNEVYSPMHLLHNCLRDLFL